MQEIARITAELQALATVKYDDYEGYTPGVKFVESLAVWLAGFDEPADRRTALQFVRSRLVYISSAEMDRLVATVYPDLLHRGLIADVAAQVGEPAWRVAAIGASPEFRARQRRTLILGMSDGARLDRLRRSSPFSTEQFHLVTELDDTRAQDMRKKLATALGTLAIDADATFASVILVDDFAATGTTMIRPGTEPESWEGKLIKARTRLGELRAQNIVDPGAPVTVLLYLVTRRAHDYLAGAIRGSGLEAEGFTHLPAHIFSEELPLHETADAPYIKLAIERFRPSWANQHTQVGGGDFALGYGGCALPLVLHHNTPNNSPPLLWRDELADPSPESQSGSRPWVGLFPRHQRHHESRP